MSGLAPLLAGRTPPGLYRWEHPARVGDVEHAVEHAGWRFVHVDGWTAADTGEVTAALADCMADHDRSGVLVLWDGWGELARTDGQAFQRLVESVRDRAAERDRFVLLLRGQGPEIDVPALG